MKRMLKRSLFDFLWRLSRAQETRSIAASSLAGLLKWYPSDMFQAEDLSEQPYSGLGHPSSRPIQEPPVFITGRFRSGSTLLWNIFRHIDGLTAYYEPLNERRWFDPTTRGDRTDPTHKNVEEYWREFDGLEELGRYYREEWIRSSLLMDAHSWDPDLKRFIELLIEKAKGRAVVKFNRVDFRLPWLRHYFPAAKIVHIYRHPREQWCSVLQKPASFGPHRKMSEFLPYDMFYVSVWASDLKYHFPFLDEAAIEHPYEMFYYLWKLSYLYGMKWADHSVRFETLVREPDTELPALMHAVGIRQYDLTSLKALIEIPDLEKWKRYADDAWFQRIESRCETVLAEFYGVQDGRLPTPAQHSHQPRVSAGRLAGRPLVR
jgi:hypothetical protein